MNLVEVNLAAVPFGKAMPFSLHDGRGALVVDQGVVIESVKDLQALLEISKTFFVDTDASGDSYKRFLSEVKRSASGEKLSQNLARIKVQQVQTASLRTPSTLEMPPWHTWQQSLTQLFRSPPTDDFLPRFQEIFVALNLYLQRAPDAALLALMQMSAEETRYYSATHSMLVSVVCMTVAREALHWPENRVQPLGCAALSMNIGMARLQDDLVQQTTPLTTQQAHEIEGHADRSADILQRLGVSNPLWLDAVRSHHHRAPGKLSEKTLAQQMARLIQRADIFGARISPRANRAPMSVTSAMQAAYYDETRSTDEAGAALVKALGIYPPGAWVELANNEVGVVVRRGLSATTPRVAVILSRSGLPTGEPIPRDTAQPQWKIVSSVAHKEVRVRLPLEKLLAL